MNNNNNLYFKLLKYLSLIYILSLSIHYWSLKSVRISEFIFILLFSLFFYGIKKKLIKISIINSDLIFSLFVLTNILLIFFNNFSFISVLGFLFSLYLFLIYFIFRNIFKYFKIYIFIESIIYLSIFSTILGILGYLLLQLNIENILVINNSNIGLLQKAYPLLIFKPAQASALLSTPNLMSFMLIIGISMLIVFNDKKKLLYSKFIFLNIGLFLTFSKSIVLYLGILILNLLKPIKTANIKYLLITISIALFFIHSFLTNFLILNKKHTYEWLDNRFTHVDVGPIYENDYIEVIATNYFFLKNKSIDKIKRNFFKGVGYEQFRKIDDKYPILNNQKPHSTYFGIFSEFGFFGLISIIIILLYALKISYTINNNFYLIIIYIIFEGINTDIISLKIIWIIFAIASFLANEQKLIE